MDPELIKLLRLLIVDKIAQVLAVIAATGLIWAILVGALQAAARWTERYRLLFQGFIPWVRAMLILSAGWVILVRILALPEDRLVYVLGVVVVAVGFSSREFIGSVLAYFLIVWNKPFQIGDRVQIGEVYGEVVDISLSCTKLRTPGDSVATFSNAAVVSSVVVNTNYASLQSMVDVDVFLDSSEDPALVKRILWEAAATSKFFYPEEPVSVRVTQLSWCTRYRVKAYTHETRAEFEFMSDVTETAKREFARRGIRYAPPVPAGANVGGDGK